MIGVQAGDVVRSAADLILGARCAGCGSPGPGPCPDCARRLGASRPFAVPGLPEALPPVWAADAYAEVVRSVLLAAKERSALGLVPVLGARLATAVAAAVLACRPRQRLVLVPVPTAPAQVAARGLDLTATLARVAARRLRALGVPVGVWQGLRIIRRPTDQSLLGRDQRWGNLRGAFGVRGRPAGPAVLIDDIVTTGATLAEACRACASAEIEVVAAATVAAALRRDREPPGRSPA